MTQKRFKKLLMAQGYSTNSVRSLVEYMKALRQSIEQGEKLVLLVDADAVTCEFKMAKIYPYAETYNRILEGRDFLV